jgi:flagellar biosynthesis component FlhA
MKTVIIVSVIIVLLVPVLLFVLRGYKRIKFVKERFEEDAAPGRKMLEEDANKRKTDT